MPIPGLKTRKPTGAVPFPLILLEGEEKAGKSWAIAELTKSGRTGTLYWIDLNEGAADEYGAIPGADYEVVELETGSYAELLDAVEKIHAEAKRAAQAGEPPVVLAIDSGTAIWNGLKDWASERARNTDTNKRKLAQNADAEITVSANFWNDAGARWRRIQTLLMTFSGIAIITARGKEVVEIKDGRPVEGSKVWSVESHKELPYSATVWMRMYREKRPDIIGARSVHAGIKPGSDEPKDVRDKAADGRLLEWLVFDALKCDPAQAHVRDLKEFHGGALMEHEKADEAAAAQQAPAQQGQQRRQQQRVSRSPEQWNHEVAQAQNPDRVYALHHEANAAGQLTDELDKAMRARVAEMQKAAKPAVAQPEPGTASPAQDDGEAEVERLLAEAEQRGMLVDELAMIAEILGHSVERLTARTLPQGPEEEPVEKVQKVVAGLRPMTITKLRQKGETAQADVYAQVKDTEYDTRGNLLGITDAPAPAGV